MDGSGIALGHGRSPPPHAGILGRRGAQRASQLALLALGPAFPPPVPVRSRCYCEELAFVPVSGRGTIYSFTVMTDALVSGFEAVVPLTVIAVELEGQDGLIVVCYQPPSSHSVEPAANVRRRRR
jgi:hypothetical protein